VVYVSSEKSFFNITNTSDLKKLVMLMDEDALLEANKKVSLDKKLASLDENYPVSRENEKQIIYDKIKEHRDIIAKHELEILSLQEKLDKTLEPTDDMFTS
ncbi:hypothetical protein YA0852_11305, partial [Pseudomonas synxantha]